MRTKTGRMTQCGQNQQSMCDLINACMHASWLTGRLSDWQNLTTMRIFVQLWALDVCGATPLHLAASRSMMEVLLAAATAQASPNAGGRDLPLACGRQHVHTSTYSSMHLACWPPHHGDSAWAHVSARPGQTQFASATVQMLLAAAGTRASVIPGGRQLSGCSCAHAAVSP